MGMYSKQGLNNSFIYFAEDPSRQFEPCCYHLLYLMFTEKLFFHEIFYRIITEISVQVCGLWI